MKNSANPNFGKNRTQWPVTRMHPIKAVKLGMDTLSKLGIISNLMDAPTGSNRYAPRIVHNVASLRGRVLYSQSATRGQNNKATEENQFGVIDGQYSFLDRPRVS